MIFVISIPMPSPKTTRQATITTTSQRVLRIAGQKSGYSVKTYVQFVRPLKDGALKPSYSVKEK